jgi:uncharacterized protein (TIGR02145 family)
LATALSIAGVAVIERKTSISTGRSTAGFQIADSGVEIFREKTTQNQAVTLSTALGATCVVNQFTGNVGSSGGSYAVTFYRADNSQLNCTDNVSSVDHIKSVGTISGNSRAVEVSVSSGSCGSSVTDSRDSAVYNTVQVGSQCWLARNMNYGNRINVANPQSNDASPEKYCYGDLDSNCTSNNNGGLYQWAEAMQLPYSCNTSNSGVCSDASIGANRQGVCPAGWHIPTDAELFTLEDGLKITGQACNNLRTGAFECNDAGTKMQSGGSSNLSIPTPGYAYYTFGSFQGPGVAGLLWSSNQPNATTAIVRYLVTSSPTVYRGPLNKIDYGFFVRCIKN